MSKNMSKVRKATIRTALQKQIRSLNAIEAGIIKAKNSILAHSDKLDTDTYMQISEVYAKLGIAITVVGSARQDAAHKLVNTLTGK